MKVSEVINELERLKEKHGDCAFNIYKSFSKQTTENFEICFDDELGDVLIYEDVD